MEPPERALNMNIDAIKKELDHFERVKKDLLKSDKGKIALIKGETLVGTFTTLEEAYKEGVRRFGKDPFLIKPILEVEQVQTIPALSARLIHADL